MANEPTSGIENLTPSENGQVPDPAVVEQAPLEAINEPEAPAAPITDAEKDAADIATFDAGIADASIDKPKDAADVAAIAAAKVEPVVADPAVVAPVKAAPHADDVDEVHKYNLKGKAAERFHEMAGTIREFAPMREVMTKYNITDAKQVEQAFETAARGIEWENAVLQSTATPQQFGQMMTIIKTLNSGDPTQMNQAFDHMLEAAQQLGARIGREIPGVSDPLAAHADLMQEVEDGDITRKRALEIVQQRAAMGLRQEHDTKVTQTTAQQHEFDSAMAAVSVLNDQLQAADPDFARKLGMLQSTLNVVRSSVHPSQWVETIRRAYSELPALPPVQRAAAPAPRVGHMPARPTGMHAGAGALRPKPQSDLEAFNFGLEGAG